MKSEPLNNYTIEKTYKFMPLGYQICLNFKEKQILNDKLGDFWFFLVTNILDSEVSNFKELKNRKGIISDKIFSFSYPKKYKGSSGEILFFSGRKEDEEDELTLNLKSSFLKSEKPKNYFFKIEKNVINRAQFYKESLSLKENLLSDKITPKAFRLSSLFFKPGRFGSVFGPTVGEIFCLEFFENKLKVKIIKSGINSAKSIEVNDFYLFSKINEIYDNF